MLSSFTILKKVRLVRGALLPLLLFIALPLYAQAAATLSISPATGSYAAGKTFTVSIVADSVDPFNSVGAKLTFDKDRLEVLSISKTASPFTFWPDEPAYSNTDGTLNFGGGGTAALTGKKSVLAITFKALKEGSAKVSYSTGSVLAADGKGTDIIGDKTGADYDIGAKSVDPPPPPPPPADTGGDASGLKPDIPVISSPSHTDETKYYGVPKAKFTWDLPPDVTAVRLTLDKSPTTTPVTNYDPAISDKEFDQLSDGPMYFHLRYKNDSGLGPIANKKILVDRTPPDPFTIEVKTDASSSDVVIKFSATDTLSGIDHYELSADGANPIKISLAEVSAGLYTLSGQSPGAHEVKVNALDKAGNTTEATGNGKFTLVDLAAAAKKIADDAAPTPTDWRLIFDIVLIALIFFVIGYLWYERNAFRHEKYIAKREADEVRDNLGNIFSALREEVGEQVGALFQKPNPSPQDREVMMNINEAIDLSEELLSKEVEDVRKLLM